jgi:hypothetical protein
MNRVVLLHFSGSVSEQFELVGMRPHVLTYEKPPSFNEFVARVRAVINVGCDVRLHGMYAWSFLLHMDDDLHFSILIQFLCN